MKARNKVIITFIALIVIIAVLYSFSNWFSKTTGFLLAEDPDNELAKCLAQNGARLYGSSSCPNCKKQESLFGSSAFQYLNYFDCTENPMPCSNIRMVPAWYVNNTMYYGVRTTAELKSLSGC